MNSTDLTDSKFRQAIIVAKRAKQIINGAKPLVDIEAQNPLTIALEEVKRGLITMELLSSVNIYLHETSQSDEKDEMVLEGGSPDLSDDLDDLDLEEDDTADYEENDDEEDEEDDKDHEPVPDEDEEE